ncbi:hypothetical protein K440DRAFT_657642 [Wilcoxina mikolae CBS 423.85]|nr:hypothetical protein K440DRAFT_657642 [Wilcoxina mikolae CBS 423.85]
MHFSVLLILSTLLAGVVSMPTSGTNEVSSTSAFEVEVMELPEGFDMKHPALDIQHQVELRKSNPKAALPQFPKGLPIKKVQLPASAAAAPAEYHCASKQQAFVWNAQMVANALKSLSDQWCCQINFDKACTPMYAVGNAAAAICSPPKRCVRCIYVGTTLLKLISLCKQGNQVSGQVVWIGSDI